MGVSSLRFSIHSTVAPAPALALSLRPTRRLPLPVLELRAQILPARIMKRDDLDLDMKKL
jgi:hypothetical protein